MTIDDNERAAARYAAAVAALESRQGVYAPRLSEELLGLGLAYRAQQRHRDAIGAFRRALHIIRVNEGLYAAIQQPLLEQLIEEYAALQDWPSVDRTYRYLYWVTRRRVGDNDPRLLPVIDRISQWHQQVYVRRLDGHPLRHLEQAEQLYDKAIEIIATRYGGGDPRLIDYLYSLVFTHYHMASYGKADYRKGEQALQRIVAICSANPGLPPQNKAIALTQLGDWYLRFDRHDQAQASYKAAFRILQENGTDPRPIDAWFSRPRRLPASPELLPDRVDRPPPNPDIPASREKDASYALVSFDVTASGRAENIQIIKSEPASRFLRHRARRIIANSRFRPRLIAGEPVSTQAVFLRYHLRN